MVMGVKKQFPKLQTSLCVAKIYHKFASHYFHISTEVSRIPRSGIYRQRHLISEVKRKGIER